MTNDNKKLLSRDDFRETVFARDGNKCVICGDKAVDAHHIIERRVWGNGGYFVDNGVSVCEIHHLEAERTTLSCETLREAANIRRIALPEHLYRDQKYDKWANPILANGTRLRGELFFDESVQKVLAEGNVLDLFTHHVKFPRTYHLPWSPGLTTDDRMMSDSDPFNGKEVVATVKMDGENTTLYSDYIHARSLDYDSHPSRSLIKAKHAAIANEIPAGWRICAENVYARHSISYSNLEDYLLVFQIWNEKNICLPWAETVEWCELIGLKHVPVIYSGRGDKKNIIGLHQPTFGGDDCEGYVVREVGQFAYSQYKTAVGKYVRAGHVTTHGHWMREKVIANELKEK